MGYEEVNAFRNCGRNYQIRPRRDAIKLDSFELNPIIFKARYPFGNEASRVIGLLVKDHIMIPGN